MPTFPRFAAWLVALGITLAPLCTHAAVPELIAYRTIPAADGSVAVELDFDTFAPPFQVIHAKRNDVKVVLGDVERGPNLPGVLQAAGAIERGTIFPFAGIGLVVDLTLHADVRPRGESAGTKIIIHIPAKNSDEEAHFALPSSASSEGVKIIRLSYADVSEVAGLIREGLAVPSVDNFTAQSPFAAATPPPSGTSYSGSSGTASNAAPTYVTLPTYALVPKDLPQGAYVNANVSVDRRLNAVILRGSEAEIAPYERMIALVDTPRRSVLLETQIVELTETGALDLGVNYAATNGHLASASVSAGNVGAPNNPLTGNPMTAPRTQLSIGATLDALEEKGEAKILASPRIVATDNRMAAILSGEAVPIFTTLALPSNGTTLLQQQLQYINVGVSLEILPRISSTGDVTADLFSEVSSIIDYVQTAPRIAVRQELTAVSVGDGQSVLIGGLLQDQEIRTLSKIPGLGDIPLLGAFFKQTNVSNQKTNLYVVITPHVLTKNAMPKPPAESSSSP